MAAGDTIVGIGPRPGRCSVGQPPFLGSLLEAHDHGDDGVGERAFLVAGASLIQGEQGVIVGKGDLLEVIGSVVPSLAKTAVGGQIAIRVQAPNRSSADEDCSLAATGITNELN